MQTTTNRSMKKGDLFTAPMVPNGGISVIRVARDNTWADIAVVGKYGMWTKRQPLENGAFPFEAEQVKGLMF
jgi:hypothetical protein